MSFLKCACTVVPSEASVFERLFQVTGPPGGSQLSVQRGQSQLGQCRMASWSTMLGNFGNCSNTSFTQCVKLNKILWYEQLFVIFKIVNTCNND